MTLLKKFKKKIYRKLSIIVDEENKNKLKEILDDESFSWFKIKQNWHFEIFDLDTKKLFQLKNDLKKKIKFKKIVIIPFHNENWIELNQKTDQIIKTKFFSISQGLSEIQNTSKYSLIIPASNSFGTGKHQSTFLIIKAIEEIFLKKKFFTAIDLGTGSGILSLILKKLKKIRIYSIDSDYNSHNCLNTNAKKNLLNKIFFINTRNFLSKFLHGKKFDLIVANILLTPLVKLSREISRHHHNNGYLIISGILKEQVNKLVKYYSYAYKLEKKILLDNWSCLIFKKNESFEKKTKFK